MTQTNMTYNEEHRQALLYNAVQDKTSPIYKNLVMLLNQSSAMDRRSRLVRNSVSIPFSLDEGDISALESQFAVTIKTKMTEKRLTATSRVAGLVFLLDSALHEHADGPGRSTLYIDGDLITLSARGLERRLVERTNCVARLATGYFREDEQLRSFSSVRNADINRRADIVWNQVISGGGENYFPRVREFGPAVTSIVVNHFKTLVGPKQLAWIANCRGAVVYGCIFFQPEMLTHESGDLHCFPGKFYIDKTNDLITLVPEADATMSITHPYTAWRDIIVNNVVIAGGKEYLCEKYKSLTGIVYYTLVPTGSDYEVPETLRTHYFDKQMVAVTKIQYPKVRISASGIPVGYDRGELLVSTPRLESVLSRLLCSANDIVKPAEAFSVLMDHNNTSVVSLDHTKVPERMDVGDEHELSIALALHVNFQRHLMRGTMRAMLEGIRTRFSLADMSAYNFFLIVMSAWFHGPKISECEAEVMPVSEVLDWVGNDFTTLISDVDPWIKFEQTTGEGDECKAADVPWFPATPKASGWLEKIYENAVKALGGQDKFEGKQRKKAKPTHNELVLAILDKLRVSNLPVGGTAVLCDNNVIDTVKKDFELTDLKKTLVHKMEVDQGAVRESAPNMQLQVYTQGPVNEIIVTPVVEVEPKAALESDILMCNGGPFDRDVVATGYRIAEVDVHKHTETVMSINDSKREIPKHRYVRYPLVNAGVEGKRIASQASLLGAAFKRNVGVPANRGMVNLDRFPSMTVDKIINTCYRPDWQDIVNKHLDTGMWQANSEDITSFVDNIDERKVQRLLDEFFLEGTVNLANWMFMAKGKIKPSREQHSDQKIDHSQTILYLENSSTNAMYSSMTRRFKQCMLECLRPEVSISAEENDEDHEKWYNSLNHLRAPHQRTYSYGVDIKCYDRSQDSVALKLDLAWYKAHGLSQERLDIWIRTHGAKKAISMMFGIVLTITQQGVSGLWKTLMRNSVVNLAAIVIGANLSRSDIVMIDIKGDDADIETNRPIDSANMVDFLSMNMNMSAKLQTNTVRYMCKQFRLLINGKWVFVADPWARAQSTLTPYYLGNSEDTLKERWISLKSELRGYDNGIIVDAVSEAAQQFYGLDRPLYGMSRALSIIANDYGQYLKLFGPPQLIQ